MRIVARRTLRRFVEQHPAAAVPLMHWYNVVRKARWASIRDVRRTLPDADAATVASGKTVTVFNIGGNRYRLIVAIHYNTQIVYVLRFLTHAQYDKDKWKEQL